VTKSAQLDLSHAPPPPRDRTHGLVVQPPWPCRGCGCELATIGEGKGPHAASLHCIGCKMHRGWLSHTTHKFLIEIINKFGRPAEPIVLRRGGQPE
jgi:hypothetical protein